MREDKRLTIISTFARDKLLNAKGEILSEQKGGPALYISKALQQEGSIFDMINGNEMEVEILVIEDGEYGRIRTEPRKKNIDYSSIKNPYLLISSLLDEYNLEGIKDYRGMVFLDVQGYVRNGKDFGKKKYWKAPEEIRSSVFCLKGTQEEISYLPTDFISSQKQKIMIVTKGKKGCELYYGGQKKIFKPFRIVETTETIGAGDTFFAYFVSQFIETGDLVVSLEYSIEKTSIFLALKSSYHHNPSF
ncbi:MAG: hypothetical protein GF370_03875 [Candidatus Nealsonbacteria bacterium]|nr:hypothetical protein [Candidatus Nealsonbacteria bacterium]